MHFGNPLFGALFALRRLMRFLQAHPGAAAVLVDEFYANQLQRPVSNTASVA
jgi:hypothetical protein